MEIPRNSDSSSMAFHNENEEAKECILENISFKPPTEAVDGEFIDEHGQEWITLTAAAQMYDAPRSTLHPLTQDLPFIWDQNGYADPKFFPKETLLARIQEYYDSLVVDEQGRFYDDVGRLWVTKTFLSQYFELDIRKINPFLNGVARQHLRGIRRGRLEEVWLYEDVFTELERFTALPMVDRKTGYATDTSGIQWAPMNYFDRQFGYNRYHLKKLEGYISTTQIRDVNNVEQVGYRVDHVLYFAIQQAFDPARTLEDTAQDIKLLEKEIFETRLFLAERKDTEGEGHLMQTSYVLSSLYSQEEKEHHIQRIKQAIHLQDQHAAISNNTYPMPRTLADTLRTVYEEVLFIGYTRMAIRIARPIKPRSMELHELVNEAYGGFRVAVEKYDESRGASFTTFVYNGMRNAIIRAIENQGKAVRIPIMMHNRLRKVRRVHDSLEQAFPDHEITDDMIADELGLTQKMVYEARTLGTGPKISGLYNKDDEPIIDRLLVEDGNEYHDDMAHLSQLSDTIYNALQKLPPHLAQTIALRHGLIDGVEWSVAEIAQHQQVSDKTVYAWLKASEDELKEILPSYM